MGKTMPSGWWFGTFLFFHIFGRIIPTDFHIFEKGWYTTNQPSCWKFTENPRIIVELDGDVAMWMHHLKYLG